MRRPSLLTTTILIVLTTTSVACSRSSSPTTALPPSREINGVFVGPMPIQPPGEDWSHVVLTLRTDRSVSGVLEPAVGIDHRVGGTFAGTNLILTVGDLPAGNQCVLIQMNIFRFEYDLENNVKAFDGTVSGNCFGPLSGSFRMERQ